ncbi:MAG: ABC transporter permease [Gammaproteobacteria bacterium]|nr:ABC transporter permease [Gammaproteobacteria bacterium]
MSTAGLIWSNLFRRKLRTVLTLFSVLVAFLLFALLRTATDAFSGGGFSQPGIDRLVVAPKYSIIEPLPVSYLREIESVEGVDSAAHADWFGGVYQDPRNFFPQYPVQPLDWFDLHPEYIIDPGELDAFAHTRTGAVAPAELADKYGWKVGDKLPFQGQIYAMRDGSRLWEFDLVGTYRGPENEPQPGEFLFHYDFFSEANEYGEGNVGWFVVRITDTERAPEIASAIDALFENSLNPTRTSTEAEYNRQFMEQVGDIELMTTGILGAVFFTILLLTGNTMAQGLRERVPELAVLKTVGFTDAAVAWLMLGEALLLCSLGAILGVLAAVGVAYAVGPQLEDFLGEFKVSWSIAAAALGTSVLLGLAVGAVPSLSARRLSIVDALRSHRN